MKDNLKVLGNEVTLAIVSTGSKNLGRCFDQYNYLVYVQGNPDDKQYDDVSSCTSAMRRQKLANMLPSSNFGRNLGAFEFVPGTRNMYVAPASIQIDSGD